MAVTDDMALWQAFAARVKLTFPFQVDIVIEPAHQDRHSTEYDPERVQMVAVLHVFERSTREPITVKTRRPCGPWMGDAPAEELLFDILDTALRHELYESVWIDDKLSRELHKTIPKDYFNDAPRRCAGCPAHIPIGAPSIYCEDCRHPFRKKPDISPLPAKVESDD